MTRGEVVFHHLRAEEEPWLADCFVPPPGFGTLAGDSSVVVFGGPGSGKSALRVMLVRQAQESESGPLIVSWRPALMPTDAQPDLVWARHHAESILRACVDTLKATVVTQPNRLVRLPGWAREMLAWFLHHYKVAKQSAQVHQAAWGEEEQVLPAPLRNSPSLLFPPDTPPEELMAHFVMALLELQFQGVWVVVDGLEDWVELDPERVGRSLAVFLSTLTLFDRSEVAYKLFLPNRLEGILVRTAGLARRRLSRFALEWDVQHLRQVVERRLEVALAHPLRLEELCSAPGFLLYLERAGGTSPRAWLDQVAPLARHYLRRAQVGPIGEETWHRLRVEHPPRLYLDEVRGRIVIGGREEPLERLPTEGLRILRYLMDRPNEVVSRPELYFRVYAKKDSIPAPGEPDYRAPQEYRQLIDTLLWRLRQVLEPDPKHPVLLVTKRGQGVTLRVRW